MHLNLADKNASRLLTSIQSAVCEPRPNLRIELLGPGIMLPDTALMLYHALRDRHPDIRVHVHSHTCLLDGAILLWLMADTRSIRPDAWIQVSEREDVSADVARGHGDYATAVLAVEETGCTTDMRTIHRHLDEYLPVSEVAGLRLFEPDLRELGLINSQGEKDILAELLAAKPKAAKTRRNKPQEKKS